MMNKFPDFPWTDDLFEISTWLQKISLTPYRLIKEAVLLQFPYQLARFFLKIPSKIDSEEATLLFTSGSSGEPKGVVLTHQNILSNCAQINRLGLFDKGRQDLLPICRYFTVLDLLYPPVFHYFMIFHSSLFHLLWM